MKKIIQRTLYFTILIILVLLVCLHLLDRLMEFSDTEINEYFKENGQKVSIIHHKSDHEIVRIVKSGESTKTSIICIHGAPGSWDAYKSYMIDRTLLSRAEIISYDRPGYGPMNDGPVTSIKDQAKVLNDIIELYASSDNIILLSHSFGGPIATYYNAMYRNKITTHLMVAPAIDPDSERYFWVSPLGYWKGTKWLIPSNYITASYEKYTHEAELSQLIPLIKNIKNKTIHIHGMKDWLAPAEGNIQYVKNQFPSQITEQIILPEAGHLLIWDEKELLKEKILQIIKK
jgi:pimeloyl-ACP methyl ester carboxylesterase